MRWLLVAVLALSGCTSSESGPAGDAGRPGDADLPAEAAAPARAPRWDPRDVDDLPAAPPPVAAGLPTRARPPATAPSLADRPVPAAVLSFHTGDAVLLLTRAGAWRSVPAPSRRPTTDDLSLVTRGRGPLLSLADDLL